MLTWALLPSLRGPQQFSTTLRICPRLAPCFMWWRQYPREKPAGSISGLQLDLGQGTSQGTGCPLCKMGVFISPSLPVGKTEVK